MPRASRYRDITLASDRDVNIAGKLLGILRRYWKE
jgi:hypothetical protein